MLRTGHLLHGHWLHFLLGEIEVSAPGVVGHCQSEQAHKAEEAQKAHEAKEEAVAKTPDWRAGSPVTRDDEDENPWAFLLGSQAELDAELKAFEAAEEAEKKAEKQAELEAAKKEKKIRFYEELRRHSKNHPVAIVNDEKAQKIARFYEALRRRDPPR